MKIYIRLSTFTLDPSLPFRINLWLNNNTKSCLHAECPHRGEGPCGSSPPPPGARAPQLRAPSAAGGSHINLVSAPPCPAQSRARRGPECRVVKHIRGLAL